MLNDQDGFTEGDPDAFNKANNRDMLNVQDIKISTADASKTAFNKQAPVFTNEIFTVFEILREPKQTRIILKLPESSEAVAIRPEVFLQGNWMRIPAEKGDLVRIIGSLNSENHYKLIIDDS